MLLGSLGKPEAISHCRILRRRMTVFIQCWYKRRFARRSAAATKLQATLRMRHASRSFQSMRSSALTLQVHCVQQIQMSLRLLEAVRECYTDCLASCSQVLLQACAVRASDVTPLHSSNHGVMHVRLCIGSLAGRKGETRSWQGGSSNDKAAACRACNANRPCQDPGCQDEECHAEPPARLAA